MNLSSKSLAVIIIVVLLGGISLSSLGGWWKTSSSKQAATFQEGEFAGQSNPADIRGSYTFGDVERNFGIPADVLAQAFGVTGEDAAGFQVKRLEEMYASSALEVGTGSVRLFTAFYNGLPIDLSSDTYLPASAAEILKGRGLSAEQSAYLTSHTLPVEGNLPTAPDTATATPDAKTEGSAEGERVIKGKTTFQELLDWGVPQERIEQVLGVPLPNPLVVIKTFCSENSLDFETLKPALQAEVDALP